MRNLRLLIFPETCFFFNFLALDQNVERVGKNQTFDNDTSISYTEYYANDYYYSIITAQTSTGKLRIINIHRRTGLEILVGQT